MLTYCTNVHPGETWSEVLGNLERHATVVKKAVSPRSTFPLGLRLSGRAAAEIDARESARFRDWCGEHGFSVPTLNGFAYGRFHGPGVKEGVYLPDWRDPERLRYTKRLADLLADWLPPGSSGSISTVPCAFKSCWDATHLEHVRANLLEALQHLEEIRQRRACQIVLALEPEPCCVLETTREAIEFFAALDPPHPLAELLGVCFDCCHQAVQFEHLPASIDMLRSAGVPIPKVQVSSALQASPSEFPGLVPFDEPTFLHQVVARDGAGALHRFPDLPGFLGAATASPGRFTESRVHYHVPVFASRTRFCSTTNDTLREVLPTLDPTSLLEIETYTWQVLPAEERSSSVEASIIREFEWVRSLLSAAVEPR